MKWPCPRWTFQSETAWTLAGETAAGSPIWIAAGRDDLESARGVYHYLFYDPDCDGSGPNSQGGWFLSQTRPDTCRENDLDSDGICFGHGGAGSDDTSLPPSGEWSIYCCDPDSPGCMQTRQQVSFTTPGTQSTAPSTVAMAMFPMSALDLPRTPFSAASPSR